jgi:hypothetical protein
MMIFADRNMQLDENKITRLLKNLIVRVPVGSEFSLLHVVQTGSGAHPASYPMGTGSSFPGGKAAEA